MLPAGLDILGRPKGENRIAHGLFSVRPSGAWNSHKKMYKLQSRHFVPGYYQPVPPGQKPFAHRSIEAPHNYLSAYGLNPGLNSSILQPLFGAIKPQFTLCLMVPLRTTSSARLTVALLTTSSALGTGRLESVVPELSMFCTERVFASWRSSWFRFWTRSSRNARSSARISRFCASKTVP